MKKENNKKLIILVGILLLVIGVSFAYLTGVTDIKGNGEIAEGNITVIKGAEFNVQGSLEFNDTGIFPGHKNVSSIKVTATGNNELIPYNLVWNGTNSLSTPLNFTVYKTSEKIEVTSTCQKQNKVENGLNYLSEECTISNVDKLGNEIASGTIETSEETTKVVLVKEEFITATSTGTVMYYYIVLEYPNLDEEQNIDMGKTFSGEITAEESNAQADISILAIKVHENGKDKDVSTLPENITEDGTGFIFDTNKSVCSNEAIPSWDYKNKALITKNLSKSGTSCYLYFTTKPIITSVEKIEETLSTMKLKVNASGTSTLKYYYSINNSEFTESNSNEHTFDNLSLNTEYTIKIKVKDTYGNESDLKIIKEKIGAGAIILANVEVKEGATSFTGIATTDEGIFSGTDDDGITYYWRGNVTNNYLKFADKWWRIIRINGDGTIRIIYDGDSYHSNGTITTNSQIGKNAFNSSYNDNSYVGFMYGQAGTSTYAATHTNANKSIILTSLETWYSDCLAGFESRIDTNAGFCGDRSINNGSTTWYENDTKKGFGANITAYGPWSRIITSIGRYNSTQSPIFNCPNMNDLYTMKGASKGNKALDKPIGLITADEVVYAGGFGGKDNTSYYIRNNNAYWTMSPSYFNGNNARVFCVETYGELEHNYMYTTSGIRPVINLRADVAITGTGTGDDPFVVN